ncbi:MAG: hypothetical protein ACYS8W_18485, partial [Planctomycetota bacterium]
MIRRLAIFLVLFIPAAIIVIIGGMFCRPAVAVTGPSLLTQTDRERLKELEIYIKTLNPEDFKLYGDDLIDQDIRGPVVIYLDKMHRPRIIVSAARHRPSPKHKKYRELIEPKVTLYSWARDNASLDMQTVVTAGIAQVFNNDSYIQVELEDNVVVESRSGGNGSMFGNPQVLKTELLWISQQKVAEPGSVPRRRILTDRPISITHDYYTLQANGIDEDSDTGVTALAGPVDISVESRLLKYRGGNESNVPCADPYWMEIHCDKGAKINSRFVTRNVELPGRAPTRVIERIPESMRFYNKVRLVRKGQIISANDRLLVTYPKTPDPDAIRPETIIAEGGVVAEHDYEVVAEGDRAVMEPLDNRFTFYGSPAVLRYGSDTLHSPVIKVKQVSTDRYKVELEGGVEGEIRPASGETGWRLKAERLDGEFELVPETDPSVAGLVARLNGIRNARKAGKAKPQPPEPRLPDPSKRVPVLLFLKSPDVPFHLYGSGREDISGSRLRFDRKTGLLILTGDTHHRPYFRDGDGFFAAGDRVEVNLEKTDATSVHVIGHVSGKTVRRMLPVPGKSGEPGLKPNVWEFTADEGWFHFIKRSEPERGSGLPGYIPSKLRLSGRGREFVLKETENPVRPNLVEIRGGELDMDILAHGGNGSGTVMPRPGAHVRFAVGRLFRFEAEKVVYDGAAGTIAFENGGIGRLFPRKKSRQPEEKESEPWNVMFARLLLEIDEVEDITAWTAYPLPGKQVDISRPGIIISGDRLRYEPPNRQANFSGNIRGRLEP